MTGARWRRGGRFFDRRALGVAGVALVLVGAIAGAWRIVDERRAERRAHPPVDGRLTAGGLGAPVEILRDGRGLPHVRASSIRDAYFGLGFAHAQDRLAQMTWLRRSAAGRTAEVLGPRGLEADRMARALAFARRARAEAERLGAATRRRLEAYAAGVNAHLEQVRAGRVAAPPPLARLGVVPEAWRVEDSLAIASLFAWGLDGSLDVSLVLWDLIGRLGGFDARPFFPSGAADTLVPEGSAIQARRPESPPAAGLAALRSAVGLVGTSVGSSAWIVSGGLTANGSPLLAADLHYDATVPALLHEAHVLAPGLNAAGVAVPGVPIFWTGHNDEVAWASTHARAAVVDLYKEALDPSGAPRYRVGSGWRPLEVREEEIEVRGGPTERMTVRSTRHGPLVDGLVGGERGPLALAWAGAEPGQAFDAFGRLLRARDAEGVRQALADHHAPVLAVLYVDRSGAGGLQVAGRVPHRALATSLVPVPGQTRWTDWRGSIPFEELPRVALGPDVRWIIAADNPLGAPRPPYRIEWLWRTGERSRRIDALLREAVEGGATDARTLAALQADVVAPEAAERASLALGLAGPAEGLAAEAQEVERLLRTWDGDTSAGSRAAAAYHVLGREILRSVVAPSTGDDLLRRYLGLRGVSAEALLAQVLEASFDPDSAFARLVGSETIRAAAREGLRGAGLALLARFGTNRSRWTWGGLHRLRFRPFGWSERAWGGLLGPRAVGSEPIPFGGNRVTVAVGEYDPSQAYDVGVVSQYRLVVDLADPGVALSTLAPGVSELPGHRTRSGDLDAWLAGEPRLLATQPLLIDEIAQARLELVPVP